MNSNDLTSAFRKALNCHGYGFQYAVIKIAKELESQRISYWQPLVPEFPVEIQGSGTRIDIIFKHRDKEMYLVCECKRANPATSNWCFAQVPKASGDYYSKRNFAEQLNYDGTNVTSELHDLGNEDDIYQIALEIKTGNKGDNQSKTRGEIEDAATQILRGYNGLIYLFASNCKKFLKSKGIVRFTPVIITTANIFTTEANISAAVLDTGELEELDPPLQKKEWIWYEYPQSPGLKHNISNSELNTDLREILYQEYIRLIAIVNPSGISNFLSNRLWRY